jgi:hypothetical protein
MGVSAYRRLRHTALHYAETPIRRPADTFLPLADTPKRRPADTCLLACFNSLEDINDLRGFFGISELIAQFVVAKNAHQSTDEA